MKKILLMLTVLCYIGIYAQNDPTRGLDVPCVSSNFSKTQVDCDTFNFTASSTAGTGVIIVGYYWTFGDGTSSTQQNPSHSYGSNGTYTVTLTTVAIDSNGNCCSHKKTMQVTVNCSVSNCGTVNDFVEFNNLCSPLVTYSIPSGGITMNPGWTITNYNWTFVANNGYTVTATGSNPTVNLSDVFCDCPWTVTLQVTATNAQGVTCIISRTEYLHSGGSDLSAGCFNGSAPFLSITPNPAQDYITLNLNTESLELSGTNEIRLYNFQGEQKGLHVLNPSNEVVSMDVSLLPKGIYFVQLVENNRILETQKLILE